MAMSVAHNMSYDDKERFSPLQAAAVGAAAFAICCHKILVMAIGSYQARVVQIFIIAVSFMVCLQNFSDATSTDTRPTRVGLAGYGKRGRLLAQAISETEGLVLVWVWGTAEQLADVPEDVLSPTIRLNSLSKFETKGRVDVVIDVADVPIAPAHGAALLERADLVVTSPGAFVDKAARKKLCDAAATSQRCIIVPQFGGNTAGTPSSPLDDDETGMLWAAMMTQVQQLSAHESLESLKLAYDLPGKADRAATQHDGSAAAAVGKWPELALPSSRLGHLLGCAALATELFRGSPAENKGASKDAVTPEVALAWTSAVGSDAKPVLSLSVRTKAGLESCVSSTTTVAKGKDAQAKQAASAEETRADHASLWCMTLVRGLGTVCSPGAGAAQRRAAVQFW